MGQQKVNAEQPHNEVQEEVSRIFKTYIPSASDSMMARRPPSARVDPPDTGRKAGLIACPFFAVVAPPGIGAQSYAQKVAERFPTFNQVDLAGQDVQELKQNLANYVLSEGLILANFPMTQRVAYEFNKEVGGLDLVVVLDCSEDVASKSASPEELDDYKRDTIPLLGYYDDRRRLAVVTMAEMDSDDDIIDAIYNAIDAAKDKPRVSYDPTEAPGMTLPEVLVSVPDTGRKHGLPDVPVVAVVGASGSGVDDVVQKLADQLAGAVLVDSAGLDGDALAGKLSSDAKVILLKGFPSDKDQVEQFNEKVGGMTGVVVIDATEDFCKEKGGEECLINAFSANTIPVLAYYDDFRKLDVVPADREVDDVSSDAQKAIEALLNRGQG